MWINVCCFLAACVQKAFLSTVLCGCWVGSMSAISCLVKNCRYGVVIWNVVVGWSGKVGMSFVWVDLGFPNGMYVLFCLFLVLVGRFWCWLVGDGIFSKKKCPMVCLSLVDSWLIGDGMEPWCWDEFSDRSLVKYTGWFICSITCSWLAGSSGCDGTMG